MKFLTAFAVAAITIANCQEAIVFGDDALVTDYRELPPTSRNSQKRLLLQSQLGRNLQNADDGLVGVAIIDDLNNRRLQDDTFNVPLITLSGTQKPLRLEAWEQKPNERIEILIDSMEVHPTPGPAPPMPDYQPGLVGRQQYGEWDTYDKQPKRGPHHHRPNPWHEYDRPHNELPINDYPMIESGPEYPIDEPYYYGDNTDFQNEHQRDHKGKDGHRRKHKFLHGFLFVTFIALISICLMKCCARKCKKNRDKKKLKHMTTQEQIQYHNEELRRLETMRQSQNVRVINPYNQFRQQFQPQQFQPQQFQPQQINPYSIPQQPYGQDRISFGQRPPMNYQNQRNIPIPVGRPIPDNSFESEYPTL